jgi:integrase
MKKPGHRKGSVYVRADSANLWMRYYDAQGQEHCVSTKTSDAKQAHRLLDAVQRKVRAEVESGLADRGPLTLARYAEKWIADRTARGIDSAADDEARLRHVPLGLSSTLLAEVTRGQVRDFIAALPKTVLHQKRADGTSRPYTLAPRTVRHVYGVLHVLFEDAVAEGLIVASPCTLKQRRKELPAKRDKDPSWRVGAVYAREEVEQLISDARIAERRRVLYALLFLTASRINELTTRTFLDYDPKAAPLGRFTVGDAFSRKHKRVKSTKTDVIREVPVHPTLAAILAEWKMGGWERCYGRPPLPGDLIMPNPSGTRLESSMALEALHKDLETLGMRRRRQHDTKRTFVSLARVDGAGVPGWDKDLLKRVTHGPPQGEILDVYTTVPWDKLCAQVLPLKLERREGRMLRMAGNSGPYTAAPSPTATVLLHPLATTENSETIPVPRAGFEAVQTGSPGNSEALHAPEYQQLPRVEPSQAPQESVSRSKRSNADAVAVPAAHPPSSTDKSQE